MYDDMLLRLPENEADMWDLLEGQFEHIAMDFGRLRLELRRDALDNRFHEKGGYIRRDGLDVVRYRNVSDELDSRSYFWEMGQALVAEVERLIAAKELTPVFAQQWGKLTFCHGYAMAHVFDDSDDLAHSRAGKKGAAGRTKDAQRQWVAHLIHKLMLSGRKRNSVEDEVVAYIKKAIADPSLRGEFETSWFTDILDAEQGQLKSTYDDQRLGKKVVLRLVEDEPIDLPPIPSKLP